MIILGKIVNSYLNKQISLVSWDSSSSVHSCTVQLKFKDSQVQESKFRPLSHIKISNKKNQCRPLLPGLLFRDVREGKRQAIDSSFDVL